MAPEVGEYLVGAYLKIIEGCDFVDYNVRVPGGGLAGLNELDVVGMNFGQSVAYLCEVTTHIRGLQYGANSETLERIAKKFRNQQHYAQNHLDQFDRHEFMLWSPVVPVGYLTDNLNRLSGLTLVINGEYAQRVDQLQERARSERQGTGNPAFRMLQILGSLRRT